MQLEDQVPSREYEQEMLRAKLTVNLRNPFWYLLPAAMGVGTLIPAVMQDNPILYLGGGMAIGATVALTTDYLASYFRYTNYLTDNTKIDEESRERRQGLD